MCVCGSGSLAVMLALLPCVAHALVATTVSGPLQGLGVRGLNGLSLPAVAGGRSVELGEALSAPGTNLLVLGTYPADFNVRVHG